MEMDQRIAIATDSSCDLSDEILAQYGISIIPLRIVYADREYRDRVEVDAQYVYERLDEELPTSSMPSLDDITATWDAIADEGYTHLLQICISSGLSGTYNAMRMAASPGPSHGWIGSVGACWRPMWFARWNTSVRADESARWRALWARCCASAR